MATKFANLDSSDVSFSEQDLYKNQTLTSASSDITFYHLRKDQVNSTTEPEAPLTTSGSQWAFIHNQFYRSGSSKNNSDELSKFNDEYHWYNQYSDLKPFHKNKFHSTASVISIPQDYFGTKIKPESFQLTVRTGSSTNTTKQIVINDDGFGNLYAPSCSFSSSNNSLSSSQNYVGNIYYNLGIITLTETGSWSGSVNYTDIDMKKYPFWDVRFNSTLPFYTSEFTTVIKAGQFNATLNKTALGIVTTGSDSGSNHRAELQVGDHLTGSGWSPYFNQIQLYHMVDEEPVIIGNFPRPIQTRKDIDLVVTFRIDH